VSKEDVQILEADLQSCLKESLKQFKELHASVSKFGKAVDKAIPNTLATALQPVPIDSARLKMVIIQHLHRFNNSDLAATLLEEQAAAGDGTIVEQGDAKSQAVTDMLLVVKAMHEKNLQPALTWARQHDEDLRHRGSNLTFTLHKQRYLQMLWNGEVVDALQFAKTCLSKFTQSHQLPEVQKLMGCLVFAKTRSKLESSPYASLFSEEEWSVARDAFTHDCCIIKGIPLESPLLVTLRAAAVAVPTLVKFATVRDAVAQSSSAWLEDSIPLQLVLSPDLCFHSVFSCPVSREAATPDNPPMLLSCGHVIAETSMRKLARGGSRLKCPYCPSEVLAHQAKRLHL